MPAKTTSTVSSLKSDLKKLRKNGCGDPELAVDYKSLDSLANAVITDGLSARRIEVVLHLAILRLETRAYVNSAEALFGLAEGTRQLDYADRRAIARELDGRDLQESTYERKGVSTLTEHVEEQLRRVQGDYQHKPLSLARAEQLLIDQRRRIVPPTDKSPTNHQQSSADMQVHDCFETCPRGEQHLAKEVGTGKARRPTWWQETDSAWFGSFFALWHKTLTTPCGRIRLIYDEGEFGPKQYSVKAPTGGTLKAVTSYATQFFSERNHEIHGGTTHWEFCSRWAEWNTDMLLTSKAQPTVFGVRHRRPYPGLTAVHALMRTADGYLLFALRSRSTDPTAYFPFTWSASFEEQVALTSREHKPSLHGDQTVLDTIEAGLDEEWGLPAAAIETSTCLALGREYVLSGTRSSPRLNLNFAIITAVKLSVSLKEV